MLTATYTLVTLSVEQASVRASLRSLQKLVASHYARQDALTSGQVDYVREALQRLHDACHWRKIEKYLIPALGRATREAERLLLDLDQLSRTAGDAMRAVADLANAFAIDAANRVARFCGAADDFCSALLRRLELEEQELFPIARTVISGEAWFSIANQMLVHDAQRQATRQGSAAIVLPQEPAEACSGAPKRLRRERVRRHAPGAYFAH